MLGPRSLYVVSAGTSLLVIGAVLLAMIAASLRGGNARRNITNLEAAWS
jgi:hypothetical protein